jgi:uncharacterized membrane protein
MSMQPPTNEPQGGPPYGGGPPPNMPYMQPGADDITSNDRLWAALSYVFGILAIIALVMDDTKNRRFVKYHAVQALGLWVVYFAYFIIAGIIWSIIVTALFRTGLGFLWCLSYLIYLVPMVLAFYFAYQAYQGKYFKIPVLTDFLIGQKWIDRPNS